MFSDLEQPLTQLSRSRRYLTLNISHIVRGTGIVTMTYKLQVTHVPLKGVERA